MEQGRDENKKWNDFKIQVYYTAGAFIVATIYYLIV